MKRVVLARLVCFAGAAALGLAACGGGGGSSGNPSDELQVTLGQPGPGDPQNYFPLSSGNLWHFKATGTGLLASARDNTVSVTAGQGPGGTDVLIVRETDANISGGVESTLV